MKCYFVDAFASKVFEGNPAGVCILDAFPSDEKMLKIAMENNLSETAYAVKTGDHYHLRWFTPGGEVSLCGHATLGTAFVLFKDFEKDAKSITFDTLSGPLTVTKNGDLLEMDFPAYEIKQVPVTDAMAEAIGIRPVEAWLGEDLVCVLDSEDAVKNANPNQAKLMALDGLLQHITAKSAEFDCVTRSYAPKLNVPEDPVCGRAHCHVVPLWTNKFNKKNLTARQASPRGGTLYCKINGDRVMLAGTAVMYAIAELYV